jgi:ribonuclease HI
MSQKYYLVRFSDGTTQEFTSWQACSKAVKGVKNVQFKGFPLGDRNAGTAWLGQLEKSTHYREPADKEIGSSNEIRLFVDGSFSPKSPYAGWGWVAVQENTVLKEGSGKTMEKALSRNIDGELEATLQALAWLQTHITQETVSKAYVVHDYAGIAHWALGSWKAKSVVAQNYVQHIQPLLQKMPQVAFEKVDAHTGQRWNEHADALAKQGLGI